MRYIIAWHTPSGPDSTTISGEITGNVLQSDEVMDRRFPSQVVIYPVRKNHSYNEYFSNQGVHGNIVSLDPVTIELDTKSSDRDHPPLINQIQQKIPDGNSYLHNYNATFSQQILQETKSGILSTSLRGVILSQPVQFEKQGSNIWTAIPRDSNMASQLAYVSNASLQIEHSGRLFQIEVQITDIQEDNNDCNLVLVPTKLRYGKGGALETYHFDHDISPRKEVFTRIWNTMRYWFKALRAEQYFITFISVLVAGSLALAGGDQPSLWNVVLIILGTFSIQAGGNLLNDYFDHTSELDEINIVPLVSPTSNKFIQDKLLHPTSALAMGGSLFVVGALVGLYLNYIAPGQFILVLGIIGAITTYFYTGEPLKLAYRGIGEIILALNFGPLIIIGSYFVLTNKILSLAEIMIYTLPPLGFITSLLILNELDDIEADRLVGKITTTVRLGRKNSVITILIVTISLLSYSTIELFSIPAIALLTIGLIVAIQSLFPLLRDPYRSPNLPLYVSVYVFWSTAVIISLI